MKERETWEVDQRCGLWSSYVDYVYCDFYER